MSQAKPSSSRRQTRAPTTSPSARYSRRRFLGSRRLSVTDLNTAILPEIGSVSYYARSAAKMLDLNQGAAVSARL